MSANVNTTTNITQPFSCFSRTTVAKIGATFAYCLIFAASLAGNSVIGIIVYKTKTLRKPINFLIVNMAMSDLLWSIFLIPHVLTMLYVDTWLISGPLGQALCKLLPFLQNVSPTVSIQTLVLIAVDRFRAVVLPLRSPLIGSKMWSFFILATWIVAMTISCPFILAFKVAEYRERLVCVPQWNVVFGKSSSFQSYFTAFLVTFIFIPLVLMAVLYSIMYLKLKWKTPGEQSVNGGQYHAKRKRNVIKMATAIVLGFAVCWLPISISRILVFFAASNIKTSSCGLIRFRFIAFVMAYTNCAINPFICFIFSGNYRQASP
ncbi:endothelin receptor type B-like [Oculina patagonica]